MCISAVYLSTLKELTFYPEKGVPTLATPERGKSSGIFFFISENYMIIFIFLQGHPRLANALTKLYSHLLGRDLNSNTEVLVTAGAYEALFVTIMGKYICCILK